jgi:hypothetical protein
MRHQLSSPASSNGLTNAQMGIDGSVTSGTGQVLVLAIRDVQVRLGVSVLLGESKINDVDLVASLANAHQEIVGFNVSMDEIARMNVLDAGNLQVRDHQTASHRR